MTYFLMLLFVWVTLFWMGWKQCGNMWGRFYNRKNYVIASLWASLGTFFFHNIW